MAARKGNMLGGSCLKQPLLRKRVCLQPYPSPGSLLSASGSFLFPCGISCLEHSFKGKYSSPLFCPRNKVGLGLFFSMPGGLGTVPFLQQPSGGRCPESGFESLQAKKETGSTS